MFLIIQPDSWDNLRVLARRLQGKWVFRGQADESWPLTTTLERALKNLDCTDRIQTASSKERLLLREFQRRAHHYIPSPPLEGEYLEWLALIQHYGGATRLLDFSHSFYVAVFFALEDNREYENRAVWAVNLESLEHKFVNVRNLDPGIFEGEREEIRKEFAIQANHFLTGSEMCGLAIGVEPERMNERLAAQQGVFLFPCSIGTPFEDNLAGTFDETAKVFQNKPSTPFLPAEHTSEKLSQATVIKIIVPEYFRVNALKDLWRMNVNTATLFPGIDGFARSLNYHLIEE